MATLSSCSTWHYNTPRIKVDRSTEIDMASKNEPKDSVATITAQSNDVENSVRETAEINNQTASTETSVVTADVVKHKTKVLPVKSTQIKKEKKGIKYFTQKLMKDINQQLFKVKDVGKTAASGWVRIMIILFVVGFILILVGIFLSVFLGGPFWWLFYGFGALCLLAAFIILILVLVGLI